MKNIKRIIGVILFLIIISVVFFKPTDSGLVKIGIILPLSGEVSSLGENAKNGALLAFGELSTSTRQKVGLIFEDDKFEPKNTIASFNKLVNLDHVSVVVCFTSTPCSAVAPLADQYKIPLIAVASAPVQIGRDHVVRLELSTQEEGRVLADYLESRSYQNIASVLAVQEGVKSAYNSLVSDSYVKNRLGLSESISPETLDFKSSLVKIISTKPDVILVGLLPGPAGVFAKQARQLGYKGDLVGFNFIEGEETLSAAQGAINGIVYTQASDSSPAFGELYKNYFGINPGPGSAHLYDAVKILSSGHSIEYLKSIKDFSGALGIYSSLPGGEFSIPVILKTVKNNSFVSL